MRSGLDDGVGPLDPDDGDLAAAGQIDDETAADGAGADRPAGDEDRPGGGFAAVRARRRLVRRGRGGAQEGQDGEEGCADRLQSRLKARANRASTWRRWKARSKQRSISAALRLCAMNLSFLRSALKSAPRSRAPMEAACTRS